MDDQPHHCGHCDTCQWTWGGGRCCMDPAGPWKRRRQVTLEALDGFPDDLKRKVLDILAAGVDVELGRDEGR